MRALALWAVLFAAYAATLGVDAVGGGLLFARRGAAGGGGRGGPPPLRRRRGPPAPPRRVDRLRRRRRPDRRVRDAGLPALPSRRAAAAGRGHPGPHGRAAGRGL